MGCFLSFTGTITYKNAQPVQEAAAFAPLVRIFIQTDCPYLTPEPKRKVSPNEPALMIHTAEKLASLRNMLLEELAQAIYMNSRLFYKI
ncbi:MAG: TatD family hydrolase, partial [Phycisphaerae bacterium]|nr:TatD family hydrolase [Phycisphaerae bacterium]